MSNKIFVPLLALLVLGIGFGVYSYSSGSEGCERLVAEGKLSEAQGLVVVALEVGGNTAEWAEAGASFLKEAVRVADVPANEELTLLVLLESEGQTASPDSACLGVPLRLSPDAGDLRTFADGSEESQKLMLNRMADTRNLDAALVADALSAYVRSLEPPEGNPLITPLPLWIDVSRETTGTATSLVAIWSPLASNAGDCLDASTSVNPMEPTPDELVGGCALVGSMDEIAAESALVAWPGFLAQSSGQKQYAQDMAEAFCALITDTCTVGAR